MKRLLHEEAEALAGTLGEYGATSKHGVLKAVKVPLLPPEAVSMTPPQEQHSLRLDYPDIPSRAFKPLVTFDKVLLPYEQANPRWRVTESAEVIRRAARKLKLDLDVRVKTENGFFRKLFFLAPISFLEVSHTQNPGEDSKEKLFLEHLHSKLRGLSVY